MTRQRSEYGPLLRRALREERCVVVATDSRFYGSNGTLWVGKVTGATVSLRDKLDTTVVTLRLAGVRQVVLFPASQYKAGLQRAERR